MRLIGTAGHIDHGKSTLVEALTGTHPSRLPEERARGMTIDLGYAHLDHPDGFRLGIVDVPGHEKLVKNMVAGATGFELALWVVDARESVMPQSLEHLQILELLGVRSLIPVVTKAGLADDGQMAATLREVAALLARTRVPAQPAHVVDSVSGRGIDGLKAALFASCREAGDRGEPALPYLPVDRAFTLKGIGTVVTGTLVRGRLTEGDAVSLAGETWRVRSLHNHGERVDTIGAGHRVGVNVAGLPAGAVRRGDTLVAPGYPHVGRFLNVRLRWVEGAPTEWKHGARLHFHAGCTEAECRLWGVERDGDHAWAQVELREPAPFFAGQRFILRATSPRGTVGGGEVLDIAPDRPRRVTSAERAAYTGGVAAYLEGGAAPVLELGALARRWMAPEPSLVRDAGATPALRTAASLAWSAAWEDALLRRFHDFVAAHPRGETLIPFTRLARELKAPAAHLPAVLHALLARGDAAFLRAHVRLDRAGCTLFAGRVALTAEEERIAGLLLDRLLAAGLRPARVREYGDLHPKRPEVVARVAAKLCEQGRAVRVSADLVLHPDAADELRRATLHHAARGLRAAEFGQALGLSRKYTIPYLEHLAQQGITRREGDLHFRVEGPASDHRRKLELRTDSPD
jgi:selenocysteine-specific elongation factor